MNRRTSPPQKKKKTCKRGQLKPPPVTYQLVNKVMWGQNTRHHICKSWRRLGKNEDEWTGKVEFPTVGQACEAIFWCAFLVSSHSMHTHTRTHTYTHTCMCTHAHAGGGGDNSVFIFCREKKISLTNRRFYGLKEWYVVCKSLFTDGMSANIPFLPSSLAYRICCARGFWFLCFHGSLKQMSLDFHLTDCELRKKKWFVFLEENDDSVIFIMWGNVPC